VSAIHRYARPVAGPSSVLRRSGTLLRSAAGEQTGNYRRGPGATIRLPSSLWTGTPWVAGGSTLCRGGCGNFGGLLASTSLLAWRACAAERPAGGAAVVGRAGAGIRSYANADGELRLGECGPTGAGWFPTPARRAAVARRSRQASLRQWFGSGTR